MARLKIGEMILPDDKESINTWHDKFKNTPAYESIERFILENYLLCDLAEVIETNYEFLDVGYKEEKKALSIKNNKNEIIGFILCDAYDMTDYSSLLYLQYIVLHPKIQHNGYGTEALSEFFNNIKKYIGFEPTDVYALVHRLNKDSISLFEKFGFDFSRRPKSRSYLRADGELSKI